LNLRVDRLELRVDRPRLRVDRPRLRADRLELRGDRPRLRVDRLDLRVDRPKLRADRLELRVDRPKLRVDRLNLPVDRLDLRAARLQQRDPALPCAPMSPRAALAKNRLAAIDVMRGIVMILMTIDHASEAFNGGRLMTDSVGMWTPGMALPAGQFLTRWITHLCAPTFVLLAGTALALSTDSRTRRGETPGDIDRHIAIRGVLLVALDAVWMSMAILSPGRVLFQVLYAIGAALLFMIPLRRLSDRALLAAGLSLAAIDEPLALLLVKTHLSGTLPAALLVVPGGFLDGHFIVGYPALPWLAIMCVGWVLGRRLLAWPAESRSRIAARVLAGWGASLLVLFVIVRGANTWGNMGLPREDGSLVQWLHVSKYPPSVSFDALELGIASLMLAALFVACEGRPDFLAPVRTLGQTALFYYLLHIHVMMIVAHLSGLHARLGLTGAYLGTACTVLALYPLARAYGLYKAAHPGGWRQYV
jgi:uncharacterized membrane protein